MCVNPITRTHKVKCSYTNTLHMQTHLGTLTFAYTYIHKHALLHIFTHRYTDMVYTSPHVENSFKCFSPHTNNHIFSQFFTQTLESTPICLHLRTHIYTYALFHRTKCNPVESYTVVTPNTYTTQMNQNKNTKK